MPVKPRALREQFKVYERAGFTVREIKAAGKHFKVRFDQFPQFQVLSINESDWHGIHNNIARFRRLMRESKNPNKV